MEADRVINTQASYHIYQNVLAFLRLRHGHREEEMKYPEFRNHSLGNLYLVISSPPRYTTIFVHSDKGSSHISKLVSDTRKLIERTMGHGDGLFVAPFDMTDAMVGKVKKMEESLEGNVKIRPYWQFLFDLSSNPCCSKHRVLSKDEAVTLVKESYISTDSLARIVENDPMVLWIGAEVGDLIEIERPSSVSLIGYEYRKVIPMSRDT